MAAFAPGAYAASATELGTKYETLDESLWSCVWNDEFDGSSVDTTKWSYTVGGGGFGNNEQQYYTDSASNSYIQDGCLVIEALQESNGDENYTSAKLTSTESWTYGRLEFRAKLISWNIWGVTLTRYLELCTTVTLGYIIPDIITWRMAHLLLMISTLLL